MVFLLAYIIYMHYICSVIKYNNIPYYWVVEFFYNIKTL